MSTTDHDREDRLRAALARSAGTYAPPPAPVGRILTEGRVRRARRRAGYAAAVAAVVAAGVALPMVLRGPSPEVAGPASGATTAAGRRAEPTATGRPTTAPHQGAAPVTTQVRSGRTDGVDWSVSLVFYPQRPAGFTPGSKPSGMPTPPLKSSLICAHVVIGGVRVDHQGGPWSDCDMVDGTTDQGEQDFYEGPWGLHDKGLSGTRIFVSSTHDAAYGTVTLTGGIRVTGQSVTVPGTRYRAWAAPVPDGAAIAAVDQYDAGHHRISHETQWR
jgi:hypothetical protein